MRAVATPQKKPLLGASVGLDLAVSSRRGVHVTRIVHSSPAALSGSLALGDVIVSIDAKPVNDETGEEELRAALAGEEGSPVWLEVSPAAGATVKMIVLVRQAPLEPELDDITGELGFEAVYHASGCRVVGHVEGGAAWLAALAHNSDAPAGARRFIHEGNIIVGIDGSRLGGKDPEQMRKIMRGRAFERVALEALGSEDGSGVTWRCDMVRAPRLAPASVERALAYRRSANEVLQCPSMRAYMCQMQARVVHFP